MNDTTVTPMMRTHVIEEGDTLATLAQHYFGDAQLASVLAKFNGIAKSAILTVGEKIKIPQRQRPPVQGVTRLGAVATDVPFNQPPVGADGLTEITVTGRAPWYADQKVWLGAAVGFGVAWLLLSKHSPLKM